MLGLVVAAGRISVFSVVLLLPFVLLVWRVYRESVELGADGLVLRWLFTKRVPWRDIEQVETTRLVTGRAAVLVLRGGRRVHLPVPADLGPWREQRFEEKVERLREWVRAGRR